ncbi:copper resistance system multicopper oxidase [Endozoicomonas sp. SM1973]|uniref:Copper resistance system multicopper oxidase n=1 Tax=Spartinivicinus marinus TaxID=2994442 RepID=A0A853IK82_9GAMM|nr:copper resistance system multicopper oxidase [Spartinivicinus marinus]MCX4029725.1 copper resistance system multicopper oxidase [Spartinivicinus marinus]NYZ68056.1 copper resistance system multicopper oxidase [Spartinivicinus marinus]
MTTYKLTHPLISRRQFVTGITAGSLLCSLGASPILTASHTVKRQVPQVLSGKQFTLNISYQPMNFTGRERQATTINGTIPAPILRWREGDRITLNVTNQLAHDSSIHWHGIILPTDMDGVPGLSFAGIKPGETFTYQFTVNQSGTYWYHSHSGFQEQTGMYGAIVIEPKEPDPVNADRDYVVMLSDWSDEAPETIYAKLKKMSHYYNFRERTVSDLWRDIKTKGVTQTWNERAMWNQMRMSETDLSDVTGYTYTFLMNGFTPEDNWFALFKKGEKVRLRFINGAAMTIFDVRIPGLKMKIVAADGQNIEPITVDEFRIGVAETYDVVVEPNANSAYTLFAQSIDRTGYASGTLTPNPALPAIIPAMEPAPLLGHQEMGMAHGGHGMDHGTNSMDHSQHQITPSHTGEIDHSQHQMMKHNTGGMDHSQHQGHQQPLGKAGLGSNNEIKHAPTEFGPHVDMRAEMPQSGLNDPGIGLRDHQRLYGRKVLTYADIHNLYPTYDHREPSREVELHLTGNMNRYMWSVNGIKFADAEPLRLTYGERLRITLVNDTMMTHPIHLHGMWSELETGDANNIPRKHTVLVQPGSKISYLVTADAKGRWAYHCHLLYHMPGMMREVRVS